MAYDRAMFKRRVMEKLDGALGHFYMAHLAKRNRQTKWVQHWLREVDRLLFAELAVVLSKPIKGRWDRAEAVAEVIAELRAEDAQHRRAAENVVRRYYNLKHLTPLPQQTTDEFYRLVDEAVDETLAC